MELDTQTIDSTQNNNLPKLHKLKNNKTAPHLADIIIGDDVKIFKDDAISFLKRQPDDSIDLIVTDPAYSGMNNKLMLGNGRIIGQYKDKGKQDGKWFSEFEDTIENYDLFLAECKRVLNKERGHIYIMFDSFSLLTLGHLLRNYFNVKNIITWDKVNIGMGHYYRRRHEYIIFATGGNNRKISSRSIPDVWRIKRVHNAIYPTQKPVEVFQTMIQASAETGYTICDPFLGSGSSVIATLKEKCKFIGCDISDKAISISKSRIERFLAEGVDELQKESTVIDRTKLWE